MKDQISTQNLVTSLDVDLATPSDLNYGLRVAYLFEQAESMFLGKGSTAASKVFELETVWQNDGSPNIGDVRSDIKTKVQLSRDHDGTLHLYYPYQSGSSPILMSELCVKRNNPTDPESESITLAPIDPEIRDRGVAILNQLTLDSTARCVGKYISGPEGPVSDGSINFLKLELTPAERSDICSSIRENETQLTLYNTDFKYPNITSFDHIVQIRYAIFQSNGYGAINLYVVNLERSGNLKGVFRMIDGEYCDVLDSEKADHLGRIDRILLHWNEHNQPE